MTREEILNSDLSRIFSNYDSGFDIDIEEEDIYEDVNYYSVIITYKSGQFSESHEFELTMRVFNNKTCEFDMAEDCWDALNSENLWSWLFFQQCIRIDNE